MNLDLPTHCPDCGQALADPQRSLGYLAGHPIWCATCEGCHTPDLAVASEDA